MCINNFDELTIDGWWRKGVAIIGCNFVLEWLNFPFHDWAHASASETAAWITALNVKLSSLSAW